MNCELQDNSKLKVNCKKKVNSKLQDNSKLQVNCEKKVNCKSIFGGGDRAAIRKMSNEFAEKKILNFQNIQNNSLSRKELLSKSKSLSKNHRVLIKKS